MMAPGGVEAQNPEDTEETTTSDPSKDASS